MNELFNECEYLFCTYSISIPGVIKPEQQLVCNCFRIIEEGSECEKEIFDVRHIHGIVFDKLQKKPLWGALKLRKISWQMFLINSDLLSKLEKIYLHRTNCTVL